MKLHRIYGAILHFTYITFASLDRITDVFFWPSIDIVVWGLTSKYFATADTPNIIPIILSGIILWTLVFSAQREVSFGILEELWNKNMINLFTTPLTYGEWLWSILFGSFVKTALSILVSAILAIVLYEMNFFSYGLYIIPFMALLMLMAWSIGFFVVGMVLRYNTRVQTVAWSAVALLAPFSAIYYSVSILPDWAQKVAMLIPASYIFEGMRKVISTGKFNPEDLMTPLVLDLVYLLLSLIYLRLSFNKALNKGLTKLY